MPFNLKISIPRALLAYCSLLLIFQGLQAASVVASRKPKADHGQNCTNHLSVIDRCSSMATYSYTTPFNQFPNEISGLKSSCERIGDGLKCLKVHGKCLTGLAKRSLVAYSTARSRHSKKLCANMNDPKSMEFLKSNECIVQSNKRTSMIASERELISSLQFLARNKTMKFDDRFHKSCCAAYNYRTKVSRDIEPECTRFKEAHEDMVNSMVGELLELACPDNAKLGDICPKLERLPITKEWKATSLTSAGLELIISFSDDNKDQQSS